MSGENIPATRMELLRTKKKIKLAKKGYNLLKKKRDALIKVFMQIVREYKEHKVLTTNKVQAAFAAVTLAQATSGSDRVKSLAAATTPTFSLEASQKNIMGVKVPSFQVAKDVRKENVLLTGNTHYTHDAREKFMDVISDAIKLAEMEKVLFSLADEIKKTKRRVNALEYIKIPELESIGKRIKSQLAEVEREGFFRLKNVKKKISS